MFSKEQIPIPKPAPAAATGFKAAYFMGLGTLLAMAINVVAIVVCLFLIAQYLEGTLHKGVHLGGTYQLFFLSAESAWRREEPLATNSYIYWTFGDNKIKHAWGEVITIDNIYQGLCYD